MKHTVGNDTSNKPFRNHFNTGIDCDSWNELVELGLASKRDAGEMMGGTFYHLTEHGIKTVRSIIKG